jgi:hypothetical protein
LCATEALEAAIFDLSDRVRRVYCRRLYTGISVAFQQRTLEQFRIFTIVDGVA